MALVQRYPQTERVQSNVTTGEMWREAARPLFLIFCVCNGLASAAELGPDQWFPEGHGRPRSPECRACSSWCTPRA